MVTFSRGGWDARVCRKLATDVVTHDVRNDRHSGAVHAPTASSGIFESRDVLGSMSLCDLEKTPDEVMKSARSDEKGMLGQPRIRACGTFGLVTGGYL